MGTSLGARRLPAKHPEQAQTRGAVPLHSLFAPQRQWSPKEGCPVAGSEQGGWVGSTIQADQGSWLRV